MGYSFKDITPNEFFYGMGEYIDYLRMRAAEEPVDDADIDPDAIPVIMLLDNLSGENITSLCGLYATFVNALLDFERKCAENCHEDDDGDGCYDFPSCDECPLSDECPYDDDDDEEDDDEDDEDNGEEITDEQTLQAAIKMMLSMFAEGKPIGVSIKVNRKPKENS